jgi:AcrR family transcriptional regulator
MARPRTDIAPRILEAARQRFRQHGVDGASLRAIAKDAKTSIGMVYYYYPTKDDLFFAVVESVYERFLEKLEKALAPTGTVEERLGRLYRQLSEVTDEEIEMLRLVVRDVLHALRAAACALSPRSRAARAPDADGWSDRRHVRSPAPSHRPVFRHVRARWASTDDSPCARQESAGARGTGGGRAREGDARRPFPRRDAAHGLTELTAWRGVVRRDSPECRLLLAHGRVSAAPATVHVHFYFGGYR